MHDLLQKWRPCSESCGWSATFAAAQQPGPCRWDDRQLQGHSWSHERESAAVRLRVLGGCFLGSPGWLSAASFHCTRWFFMIPSFKSFKNGKRENPWTEWRFEYRKIIDYRWVGWNWLLPHRFGWFVDGFWHVYAILILSRIPRCYENLTICYIMLECFIFPRFLDVHLPSSRFPKSWVYPQIIQN